MRLVKAMAKGLHSAQKGRKNKAGYSPLGI